MTITTLPDGSAGADVILLQGRGAALQRALSNVTDDQAAQTGSGVAHRVCAVSIHLTCASVITAYACSSARPAA
jgi:hypothetical protein